MCRSLGLESSPDCSNFLNHQACIPQAFISSEYLWDTCISQPRMSMGEWSPFSGQTQPNVPLTAIWL